MAKSGLKHIDVGAELTKTEWESEDSHELLHGSSFPSSPVERQLFYRDDEHKWYIYTGAAWTELTGGGSMSVHGNEYHDPDFEQQGVAATLIETHRTTATHTQPQPPSAHKTSHQDGGSDEMSLAGLDGEPSTLATHKTATTGVHGAGSNHLALAPAASHLVRTFSKGWTSGKHLKGAGVDADPTQVGSWEVIAEIDVAADCTYVDFTSLDGNADEFLILLATLKNATGTGYSVLMYVNGDYTDSHYHTQVIDATGSTLLAANYNYPYMGGFGANSCLNVMAYINRDPSGYYRYYTFTHRFLAASTDIQNWAGNKNDATISNLTSLRILTGTNAIAAGSKLMLCRVRSG